MNTVAGILPHEWLTSSWYTTLTAFVAVNTILYVVLSVAKIVPRLHPSGWLGHGDAAAHRSEGRSIYGDQAPPPS